jgi:hypothetical protein
MSRSDNDKSDCRSIVRDCNWSWVLAYTSDRFYLTVSCQLLFLGGATITRDRRLQCLHCFSILWVGWCCDFAPILNK